MPLVATWTESDVLFGAERTYCHTFFALADGSALAFFQFADPDDQKLFKTDINFTPVSPHRPRRRPGDPGRHQETDR